MQLQTNKTGAFMSPIDSIETKEGAENLTQPSPGSSSALSENRIRYMKEADPIGTMPLPPTTKGISSTLKEMMKAGDMVFMDKLGERLAFERGGTRLYEALLSKYHGTENKKALPPLNMLVEFYENELIHFSLISDVITELGGDPSAVTPAADVVGVASLGWIQVISDPRTTFLQSLEIILQAELVDNSCWELLVDLAENIGREDLVDAFKMALEEEAFHLESVNSWVRNLTLGNEAVVDVSFKH